MVANNTEEEYTCTLMSQNITCTNTGNQNGANCCNALHSFTKHQTSTYSNILVKEHIPYNDNSYKVMETIALLWKQHKTVSPQGCCSGDCDRITNVKMLFSVQSILQWGIDRVVQNMRGTSTRPAVSPLTSSQVIVTSFRQVGCCQAHKQSSLLLHYHILIISRVPGHFWENTVKLVTLMGLVAFAQLSQKCVHLIWIIFEN